MLVLTPLKDGLFNKNLQVFYLFPNNFGPSFHFNDALHNNNHAKSLRQRYFVRNGRKDFKM
jgi:hypothetical protein